MTSPSTEALKTTVIDKGHRCGNFHSYYTFHPPSARLEILKKCGILEYIASHFLSLRQESLKQNEATTTTSSNKRLKLENDQSKSIFQEGSSPDEEKDAINLYICDVGCNEGNLTMDICNSLMKEIHDEITNGSDDVSNHKNWNDETICLHNLGIDIDPTLIERANAKITDKGTEIKSNYKFQVCDVGNKSQHESCYQSFLPHGTNKFDLITVFSTTMWIHLHSGDEGLKEFIKRVCQYTNLLLIEPQPSKCYRNANVRLRKMNLPEFRSLPTLSMRSNIESKIEKVIVSCGFKRVCNNLEDKRTNDSLKSNKTLWNRSLHLYERIDILE